MKKLLITLVMGMLLCPATVDAKYYKVKHGNNYEGQVIRTPALYRIGVSVDSESGDLYVCPNYDITWLEISITGNGVTYLDTTVSLAAGQVYTDCLDYLDEGTYTLTLSNSDGNVIAQYEITVEDD